MQVHCLCNCSQVASRFNFLHPSVPAPPVLGLCGLSTEFQNPTSFVVTACGEPGNGGTAHLWGNVMRSSCWGSCGVADVGQTLYWSGLSMLAGLWLALGWLAPVWAFDRASSVTSPTHGRGTAMGNVITGRPAGAWHGTWEVPRDDPDIRTRAGSLALRFRIEHARHGVSPHIHWEADRAICQSPLASPCEWVGTRGKAVSARVVAGHLLAVLQVSADDADPFVVWLERPDQGRSAQGSLLSARGDLSYRLQARRF